MHILHKELSYKLNGILFKAHNELGRYASESQVSDRIEFRLKEEGIQYKREFVLQPMFEGERAGRHRVDFLVENKIVLELKCRRFLQKEDYEQVQRYLNTLNLALGILVNFREERINPKRVLNGGGKE